MQTHRAKPCILTEKRIAPDLTRIPASIEVSPKQALESPELAGLFPQSTRVYLTDIGIEPLDRMIAAARRMRDLGYEPVPHFAARRVLNLHEFETRVRRSAEEAGVRDVLAIGGGVDSPTGPFQSAMDMIGTELFDRYGIRHIAIAGHPEGSPDFNDDTAIAALKLKQDFANRSDARMRILTQFGFDAAKFIGWADGLASSGIDLPVHIGVAGPAKITTLIKYAAMCGVGNSLAYLRKNALSLTTLATGHSPESVVSPVEKYWMSKPDGVIQQVHVFPFGGVRKSAEWLMERGSWTSNSSSHEPVLTVQTS
jgi:methylenetetrahydrofolate reductase (NADPH)